MFGEFGDNYSYIYELRNKIYLYILSPAILGKYSCLIVKAVETFGIFTMQMSFV